jgi:hypothetical protein
MQKDGFPFMRYISLFLLFCHGYATEFAPWFPTPFEIDGRLSSFFEHATQVQSPLGNFKTPTNDVSVCCSLDLTPWPDWNVETELCLTHTQDVAFAYEAAFLTLRHAWLDDIRGDPVSLVTGVTVAFPGHRFLHELSFPYHGHVNAEFHATVGKEWTRCQDWFFRAWSVAGFGVADRGSSWLHGVVAIEARNSSCTTSGIFVETLCGLGKHNLMPHAVFNGYGSIAHRNVDLGGFYSYCFPYYGTLSAIAWYNLYAHNYIHNYWGLGLSLIVPFSIL